jgi:porin
VGRLGSMTRLITILAVALLATGVVDPRTATADDVEPQIKSWMLPPSTRPVWGLLDSERVRGSGPTWGHADSLTGNWGGYRDRIRDEYGIAVLGDYTSECAGNPVGGNRQGVTYTHNIGLSFFADLGTLVGLHYAAFLVSGSDRAGTSLSARDIENVYAAQQIFGGETIRLVHLAVAKALFHRRLRIVAGRINGLDDFIASPLYCNAQNLAFCGNPLSIPSDVNISSYPNTMWGTRIRWEPHPTWYAMGGVYNAVAGFRANKYHGVDFSIRHDSGVIGIMETGVAPEEIGIMPRDLPGHVKVGGYYDTEPLKNFATGLNERGTWGTYIGIDQKVWAEGDPNGVQGLSLFAAFHHAPSDVNSQTNFLDCGAVYVGLIPGRDTDVAGFYFAYGWFSDDLHDSQRASGLPGQEYESVLEINYRWNALPWFYVQPDIQGIINPGAAHQFGHALVLALQFGVPF